MLDLMFMFGGPMCAIAGATGLIAITYMATTIPQIIQRCRNLSNSEQIAQVHD